MGMKRVYLAVVFGVFLTAILSACATSSGPRAHLTFGTPKGKQIKFSKGFDLGRTYILRLVWEGKSIDDWSEASEVINGYRRDYPVTPVKAYESLMEARKSKCPESAFTVLSQDESSILYETKTINCSPFADENSFTRILYGDVNVFTLIYTKKLEEIPPGTREEWIKILTDAHIETPES